MTREKQSELQSRLWFDQRTRPEEIRLEIIANAEALTELTILNLDFINGNDFFTDLELPALKELTIASIAGFDCPQGWRFLHGLSSLRALSVGRTVFKDSMIGELAAAPWWRSLRQLELHMFDLNKTSLWPTLWHGQVLQIELLCLFYLTGDHCLQVLAANLPDLRYLILGSEADDQILNTLAETALPSLEDLELRHTNITPEGLYSFLHNPRPGLPKLKRVGKNVYSDRRVDCYDWNGAVVDWGYELMSDAEVHKAYFKDTGVSLLPSNFELDTRLQSNGHPRLLSQPG